MLLQALESSERIPIYLRIINRFLGISADKAPAEGQRQKGASKTARIPIKVVPAERLKKPDWIRVRLGDGERFQEVKRILREQRLHTVCEEATCPNIGECFGKGPGFGMRCQSKSSCPIDCRSGRPQFETIPLRSRAHRL